MTAPDDKTTPVMIYTARDLVRAELVTKANVRINTWLRTDSAPEYLHLRRVQVISFAGTGVKTLSHAEMFFPTAQAIAYHLVPPVEEPLDYDDSELNRTMQPIEVLVGTFQWRGLLRISTQTDIGTSIATLRSPWMSIYQIEVTNPFLPQMPALQVSMGVVRPSFTPFAIPAS